MIDLCEFCGLKPAYKTFKINGNKKKVCRPCYRALKKRGLIGGLY